MIRTILTDDHKLFCDGLERVLNDSGHFQVVQKFYNGQSLLEKMQAYNADLLVIDAAGKSLAPWQVFSRESISCILSIDLFR